MTALKTEMDELEEIIKEVPDDDVCRLYIYKTFPAAERGSVMPVEVRRDVEISSQLIEHLKGNGGSSGTYDVKVRGKKKSYGSKSVAILLPTPSAPPPRLENPAPPPPEGSPRASIESADPIKELVRRKKELDDATTALLGPEEPDDDEEDDEEEEEEPEERPGLGDMIADSMTTPEGQQVIVGVVASLAEEAKGVLGALAQFLKHGRTPLPATPSVGQPAAQQPRPAQQQPARSVPLRAVENPKPAPPPAPPEEKKASG